MKLYKAMKELPLMKKSEAMVLIRINKENPVQYAHMIQEVMLSKERSSSSEGRSQRFMSEYPWQKSDEDDCHTSLLSQEHQELSQMKLLQEAILSKGKSSLSEGRSQRFITGYILSKYSWLMNQELAQGKVLSLITNVEDQSAINGYISHIKVFDDNQVTSMGKDSFRRIDTNTEDGSKDDDEVEGEEEYQEEEVREEEQGHEEEQGQEVEGEEHSQEEDDDQDENADKEDDHDDRDEDADEEEEEDDDDQEEDDEELQQNLTEEGKEIAETVLENLFDMIEVVVEGIVKQIAEDIDRQGSEEEIIQSFKDVMGIEVKGRIQGRAQLITEELMDAKEEFEAEEAEAETREAAIATAEAKAAADEVDFDVAWGEVVEVMDAKEEFEAEEAEAETREAAIAKAAADEVDIEEAWEEVVEATKAKEAAEATVIAKTAAYKVAKEAANAKLREALLAYKELIEAQTAVGAADIKLTAAKAVFTDGEQIDDDGDSE